MGVAGLWDKNLMFVMFKPFLSLSLSPLPLSLLPEILTVNPANNQFISFDSAENITYTCTVPASRSVVWEFRGSQIRSPNQFATLADLGVIIDPANTMAQNSTISISQSARELYNDITVQRFSDEIGGINSVGGVIYSVVTVCKLIRIELHIIMMHNMQGFF